VELRRDSIYVTDSVSRQAVGDTVYLTRLRTVYRERLLRDTVQTQLRDSVVTVSETATKLSAWEQCKLKWGGRAIAALAALVVAAAVYYLPRWR
jgi:N-acetylglucosamine-6-phosphate deacetylase